jgi:hypothetical protein
MGLRAKYLRGDCRKQMKLFGVGGITELNLFCKIAEFTQSTRQKAFKRLLAESGRCPVLDR